MLTLSRQSRPALLHLGCRPVPSRALKMSSGYSHRPGCRLRTGFVIGVSLVAGAGIVLSGTTRMSCRPLVPGRAVSYLSVLRQEPPGSSVATGAGGAISSPRKPVGYAAHVLAQPDPGRYVRLIEDGAATSLRDDVSWASVEAARGKFDWSGADKIVTQAAAHHLHVLMIVDTSPAWASGASTSASDWFWLPPRAPATYGTFAAAVAARYGAGGRFWHEHPRLPRYLPSGIELWNEENLSGFWGGRTPNPAAYAAMVKSAYARIKKTDPAMTVMTGGLAPAGAYNDVTCSGLNGSTGHDSPAWKGIDYLQALYAHGRHGHFDAVAWHPYIYWNGASAAQMLAYHRCSAWTQMASTPVSARSLMTSHGDGRKQLWITETGAPTCVTGATFPCVSPAQQASLATRETRLWKRWRWAGGFYWYDIRDDNLGAASGESHFGAVLHNDSPKPAYAALRRAWR